MSVFGHSKVYWQLFIQDDGSFKFRNLPVQDSSMVEKDSAGAVTTAWPIFHKIALRFSGHKGIKPCMLSICCERDILLDIFNKLDEEDKPEKGDTLVKDWIQTRADMVRYRLQKKPGSNLILNKVTVFLGVGLLLELLTLGMKVAFIYSQKGG